jgi:hypothetical protein
MDSERTMEFLLEQAARADARMAKLEIEAAKRNAEFEKRNAEFEKRHAKAEARLDRTDKQIKGLITLMKMGAKQFGVVERQVKEVAAAQKRTEATLDRFISSLGKPSGKH